MAVEIVFMVASDVFGVHGYIMGGRSGGGDAGGARGGGGAPGPGGTPTPLVPASLVS